MRQASGSGRDPAGEHVDLWQMWSFRPGFIGIMPDPLDWRSEPLSKGRLVRANNLPDCRSQTRQALNIEKVKYAAWKWQVMSSEELQDLIEAGKRQAGINDVIKLHRDHMDRVNRNTAVLRTRYHKGILLTSNSTY